MKNTNLTDAVETILNTRAFCGNEAEALREWQAENGKLTVAERAEVWAAVETAWRKSQLEAGVQFPLSTEERARAYADIESGV